MNSTKKTFKKPSFGSNRKTGHMRRRSNTGRFKKTKKNERPMFDPSQFINTNPVEEKTKPYTPKHSFSDFGFDKIILKHVAAKNIITPSPIQDQVIPKIIKGVDVVGLAETGTGKTAAFLLPLIQRTMNDYKHKTLILAPTRELATQIKEELFQLSRNIRIRSILCVGGMNINPQLHALKKPHQFVIGTPGRILDLIERTSIKPELFRTVVLDEADRMLDMGFIRDIEKILKSTPVDRNTLFFSATMDKNANKLVHDFMNNPVAISVKKRDVTNSVKQDIIPYEHRSKFETLKTLLENKDLKRVIIFGSMKHSVEKLAKQLTANHFPSESLHGNKNHAQRNRALEKFKKGLARILVATDVAARGIHVDNVSHVINYDLPQTFEDYVHRIGRTGRGDKYGNALTFVPKESVRQQETV